MADIQKITPHFWLFSRAEEAAGFYTSVFNNSKIVNSFRLPEDPVGGSALVEFELEGQRFTAFDGIPEIPFTEAISFIVNCENQDEVDYFWDRLTEGGEEVQCGWLKDKFGVSWQIVPIALMNLLDNPAKASKVIHAMLPMKNWTSISCRTPTTARNIRLSKTGCRNAAQTL